MVVIRFITIIFCRCNFFGCCLYVHTNYQICNNYSSRKSRGKIFLSHYLLNLSPIVAGYQYGCYLLAIVEKFSILDAFVVCWLRIYSIILSCPNQISERRITLKLLLTQSEIMYEISTPRNVSVLKDSFSFELWLPSSTELVEEGTDVPCLMELLKMYFEKHWVNCKKSQAKGR